MLISTFEILIFIDKYFVSNFFPSSKYLSCIYFMLRYIYSAI